MDSVTCMCQIEPEATGADASGVYSTGGEGRDSGKLFLTPLFGSFPLELLETTKANENSHPYPALVPSPSQNII
jgi:hypothetical protein